jgi:hypothetical protein
MQDIFFSNFAKSIARRRRLTGVFFLSVEELLDLLTDFTFRNFNVILGLTVVGHQGEESIVRNVKLLMTNQFCQKPYIIL